MRAVVFSGQQGCCQIGETFPGESAEVVQGACEEVLRKCQHMQKGDGIIPLCEQSMADLMAKCEDMSSEVQPCLDTSFSVKNISYVSCANGKGHDHGHAEYHCAGLIFVLIAILPSLVLFSPARSINPKQLPIAGPEGFGSCNALVAQLPEGVQRGGRI